MSADLVARTADIAAKARAATPTKAANRDDDPQMAHEMDEYRRLFEGCDIWKIVWPGGRVWEKKRKFGPL